MREGACRGFLSPDWVGGKVFPLRLRENSIAGWAAVSGMFGLNSILRDSCFGCAARGREGNCSPTGELQVPGFAGSEESGRVHTPIATISGKKVTASQSLVKSSVPTPDFDVTETLKDLSGANLGTLPETSKCLTAFLPRLLT